MSTETDILERLFAAINRNDINAAMQDFDPNILRIEPEGHASQAPVAASQR